MPGVDRTDPEDDPVRDAMTDTSSREMDPIDLEPAPDPYADVEWFELDDPTLAGLKQLAVDEDGQVPESARELVESLVNAPGVPARYAPDERIRNVKQRAFLVAYATCGANITVACRAAGVHRTSHGEWMKRSVVYTEAFADAHAAAIEQIEAEAHRRGVVGILEPVFNKDGQIGVKRRFSDTLLTLRLKALSPDKYAEPTKQTVSVTGHVDHRVHVDVKTAARDRILTKARQLHGQDEDDALDVLEISEASEKASGPAHARTDGNGRDFSHRGDPARSVDAGVPDSAQYPTFDTYDTEQEHDDDADG